jgi:23S rRNA pseudouridine1911/1915/1917 synthase
MAVYILEHRVAAGEEGTALRLLAEEVAGEAGALAVARGGAWVGTRRLADPEERLPAGATLTLRLPPAGGYGEVALGPGDIAYEDAWLLAVHKRMGWYVAATPWDREGNLLAAAGRYLAARDGRAPPLHLAHRLDRDTTGVLLLSKAPEVNAALQVAFTGGRALKAYSCLCAGAPIWSGLELRTGHGRGASGRWRLYPLDEAGRELPMGGGRVKLAHSSFALERPLRDAALLRARLHTGRTHQIRLHLAHVGHPLLGDTRYGGPATYAGVALPGHLLHAAALRLPHPASGAMLELASPLPPLFEALVAAGSDW